MIPVRASTPVTLPQGCWGRLTALADVRSTSLGGGLTRPPSPSPSPRPSPASTSSSPRRSLDPGAHDGARAVHPDDRTTTISSLPGNPHWSPHLLQPLPRENLLHHQSTTILFDQHCLRYTRSTWADLAVAYHGRTLSLAPVPQRTTTVETWGLHNGGGVTARVNLLLRVLSFLNHAYVFLLFAQ